MHYNCWTSQKYLIVIPLLLQLFCCGINAIEYHYKPALECYDRHGRPQKCLPEFINAAYQVQIEATNTCGEYGPKEYCVQKGYANRDSCENCYPDQHHASYLTDLHDPQNPTWWQSDTMYEGIQHPNQVNLTLHLGKSFDITYIRLVFHSPRPESFAIYKKVTQNGPWMPYQYYSATCRATYGLPDSLSFKLGEDDSRALCTSEYSDISPLKDGNVAFSSLEGRPSAYNFENSPALQNWVTATDIKITLDRLNTFGDELFSDAQVLKSYFYSIADIAVGARCKCNGHASKCVLSTGLHGERTVVCECKHNTDGPDCERCLPNYNDVEWKRATSQDVNECKPCNCYGYSEKCFFDQHLFNKTGRGGHCVDCRDNRDGPNCGKCKKNFYMRDDGYCINCGCDPVGSRSLQCNAEGRCQCRDGVTGEKCDRCAPNFYQFGPHGCQPCGCDMKGSLNNLPSCDPVTGVCACKENVEGKRCKECKPGYFNLDLDNRFGCTPCFCYGHTSECQSGVGYSIISVISTFNKQKERWSAIDNFDNAVDLKYNQYSHTVGITAHGNDFIYFVASDRFLGNQRASYNRLLKFKLQLVGQIGPNPSSYDVVLEGAGTKIYVPIFAQGNPMPDQESREYSFRLHEHPDYSWQPKQSARGFMSILTNLTAIKIRANYANQGEAILDDVELQSAHKGAAGRPATWIELCTCPEGYVGQFCESCLPGFHHSPGRGGSFNPCIPCDCNKHATYCNPDTGRCICQHNTTGDTCDRCARGYYGNALGGTANDCKRCPCPNDGACVQVPDDSVVCVECPNGYFGARCEQCADGYYGDPNGLHGPVMPCKHCDCNGNADPNAVGNCNRTSGECLKCIYNTAGPHCEQCLEGYFGDPLALPHGQCEQCSCYPAGTEQTNDGILMCDQQTGSCKCKSNVIGSQCNECEPGYYNIVSGNGCESCNCNAIGSFNATCDRFTGQCHCKPGVIGLHCDKCEMFYYGFSSEGCKACDCDESGSKGSQCDETGQCPCNENVEGKQCNRCKENKYDRHQGCLDCPACYNLVKDAADLHRDKIKNLSLTLEEIARTPVANDEEFESKLAAVEEKINILLADAKSAAGGGDLSLVERLDDFKNRLRKIKSQLEASSKLCELTGEDISMANKNVSNAMKTIKLANEQLTNALNLLKMDGFEALAHARDKAKEIDSQSEQISDISRQARGLADNLKSEADFNLKTAKDANDVATKAFELAKNSISLQKNISDELRTNVRLELELAKNQLNETIRQTKETLKNVNDTYDAAVALLTDVGALTKPDINIADLKKAASIAFKKATELQEQVKKLSIQNDEILTDFAHNHDLATVMIERALVQKGDAIELYEKAENAYKAAKAAVDGGDETLKKTSNVYETLAGFQSQVQQSKQKAILALQNVSRIRDEVSEAEQLVDNAQNSLSGAKKNANEARANAQEAQEKYAEKATKDAAIIRDKANESKLNARKLQGEADQLDNRVKVTENRINNLEDLLARDDKLVDDAKKKVGEAKLDANEAQNQINKAIQDVKSIKDELENLRDINPSDLDALESRLIAAESELQQANLTVRLEKLQRMKSDQNTLIKKYENEVQKLQDEVYIIKNIADRLPNNCFKAPRLEVE